MDRRRFLLTSLAGALATPIGGVAQQQGKVYKIGLLGPLLVEQAEPYFAVFRQRMREHGWVEGQHFTLEIRMAEGRLERFPDLANDLVRSNVAVIVAWTTLGVRAAKLATTTTPIVIAGAGDAVGAGLVASLARPGANVTGVSWLQPELSRKYLELLRELLPGASHIGVLFDPTGVVERLSLDSIEETASILGLRVKEAPARNLAEIEAAFVTLQTHRVAAVIVVATPVFYVNQKRIFELAAKSHLPALYASSELVRAGGLMSYGVDFIDLTRYAADYVVKILRGAKPADLPVQQPTKFEVAVNLKTARALGLTIPPSLLARADQVIE
jgi:putative tryptophan/tyrosine transport system substrate-binding protein